MCAAMVDERILIAIIVILVIFCIMRSSCPRCAVCDKPVTSTTQTTQTTPAQTPQPASEPYKTREVSTGVYPNTHSVVCLYKEDNFSCKQYNECVKGAGAVHDVNTAEYAKCGTGSDPSIIL